MLSVEYSFALQKARGAALDWLPQLNKIPTRKGDEWGTQNKHKSMEPFIVFLTISIEFATVGINLY